MEETKIVSYPYPKKLHDDEGYPTQEALDYIKNWGYETIDGEIVFGEYFMVTAVTDYTALVAYLKSLWYYDDGIVEEDGMLEIHTFGWSGNEDIIHVLKNTVLWTLKHRATQTGGHYYFRLNDKSGKDWSVEKVDSMW